MSAIKLAKEKDDITLVVTGNVLKRKSEEAFEDVRKLQETIVLLKEIRQRCNDFVSFIFIVWEKTA